MSLTEVLIDELRDLYSAENQLVKSLPKSIKGSTDPEMKNLFREHLEQTKAQVLRLREVFQHIGKKPTGQHCSGMEGCIKEMTEALEKDEEGSLKDVGIIGAALRVEHYEIAGYSAALAIAKSLGHKEIVTLLTETLEEEKETAKKVLGGAKPILKQAASQGTEEDEEKPKKAPKEKTPQEQESEQKSEQDEQEAEPEMQTASADKKTKLSKK